MTYLYLFLEFFKTGLFAVGGGLATLPFLKDISLKYPWFTPDDLLDMIAISESTPGPIGVNTATYAGFHAAGLPGALVATGSLVLPSIIIIILISRVLTRFRSSKYVNSAFYALRPASSGLILGAMAGVFVSSLFYPEAFKALVSLRGAVPALSLSGVLACVRWPEVILFVVLLVGIIKLPKLHPIVFILAGAACGLVFQF